MRSPIRHAVTLVAGLFLASAAPTIYAQSTRIAVVDLQRALSETDDGRRAKARLEKLQKQRQAELEKAQQDLKKATEDYQRQEKLLSAEAKQRRQADLQKRYVDLQQKYVEYQQELAQREGELTQEILARMQKIIRRMGQADGYTLILERSEGGVVWSPSNLDLTDQLIQRYEAGEGGHGSSHRRSRGRHRRRSGHSGGDDS